MASTMRTAKWRLAVNVAGFLGVLLINRDGLLPNDVVDLFMDKMNDPHPQMRTTAQNRMMLVLLQPMETNSSISVYSLIWGGQGLKRDCGSGILIFPMK